LKLILELALAIIFTTKVTAPKSPAPAAPSAPVLAGSELARAIKTDIEAISGPGSVDVSIDHETLYTVRIAVPSFRREIYTPIYDHALELYRQFPDLSFDFYLRLKTAANKLPRR
jgi:hypothetical protein